MTPRLTTSSAPLARARRYEGFGFQLIEPKAYLELFLMPEPVADNRMVGDVAVVDIEGPLSSRAGGWCDSYDGIIHRVTEACGSAAKAIVLQIDSPGGDAQGCFECVREIRAKCAAASKPLFAFVERACSGGYALATAAQHITLSETAMCGSIGVLSTRHDYSAWNASRGLRIEFITSGARKADGHPDLPISEAELKSEQEIVDSLAATFYALVAEHRGVQAQAVAALEARVFHGQHAVQAGLADDVGTFQTVLARIAAGETTGRSNMSKLDEALAMLGEVAQGDGEDADKAAAAIAAAAADGGEDDKDKESTEDDADDDDKESAEDSEDDDDKDKVQSPAPGANATAKDIALQALAEAHKANAKLAEREARDERERLISSRKDFSPQLVAALRDAPLKTVRQMVKTLPKGPMSKAPKVDNTTRAATRGQDSRGAAQGDGQTSATPPREIEEMERRLGITAPPSKQVDGVERTPHKLTFGKPGAAKAAPKSAPAN